MAETRGFTLIEMVVSLTILSLLTLATLTAVRTLGDTQTRLESTAVRLDELRMVSQFLRNTLRQAKPVATPGSFTGYFEGEDDELRWAAPLQGVQGVAGMQFMRLYRENDSLFIQFVPYHPSISEPEWSSVRAHRLLDAVSEFQIEYRPLLSEPWLLLWEEDIGGMPQLVKIQLRVRDRYWPDLVVPLDYYGSTF